MVENSKGDSGDSGNMPLDPSDGFGVGSGLGFDGYGPAENGCHRRGGMSGGGGGGGQRVGGSRWWFWLWGCNRVSGAGGMLISLP